MGRTARRRRGGRTTRSRRATSTAAERLWWRGLPKAALRVRPGWSTISGAPLALLYTGSALRGWHAARDLGLPGEYPFTRGIHATMYRGKPWTIRQFAGYGTARATNARLRFLLGQGQRGLSIAFDMPTLMGRDSDDPMARGEVGRCGVAVDSVEDMDVLFEGIPVERITTSMTINGPAVVILAMYVVAAERRGIPARKLAGTIQNDILKEYMAQKEWIFPPRPSLRIIRDMLAYCTRDMPLWNTISISGYHIREAGSTAAQELAFTLANGFTYVEEGLAAGLAVDAFAPRLSFFFNAHLDFFEEIAKFRAARRMWARVLRTRYGAKDPRSWRLRFHTQTAGCSLTRQQPHNNIVRTAYEALAAVLGGTQSLHTNSMDEQLALPSEEAVEIALRTQQVLAEEIGVTATADPLGGSYYVEAQTNRLEAEAGAYLEQIRALGGVVRGIERGFFQREIARAAYRYQREVERKARLVVGVNAYQREERGAGIPLFQPSDEGEREQCARVAALRRAPRPKVRAALDEVERAAAGSQNLLPVILQAVRARATVGEVVGALKRVFGAYRAPEGV